VNDKKKVSINV
jgi:electron-transferring-flavoprotein dehydrogenase